MHICCKENAGTRSRLPRSGWASPTISKGVRIWTSTACILNCLWNSSGTIFEQKRLLIRLGCALLLDLSNEGRSALQKTQYYRWLWRTRWSAARNSASHIYQNRMSRFTSWTLRHHSRTDNVLLLTCASLSEQPRRSRDNRWTFRILANQNYTWRPCLGRATSPRPVWIPPWLKICHSQGNRLHSQSLPCALTYNCREGQQY